MHSSAAGGKRRGGEGEEGATAPYLAAGLRVESVDCRLDAKRERDETDGTEADEHPIYATAVGRIENAAFFTVQVS
eukprot:SAG11_NODE_872_length_6802_cov_8.951514_7_plen_76_part_00